MVGAVGECSCFGFLFVFVFWLLREVTRGSGLFSFGFVVVFGFGLLVHGRGRWVTFVCVCFVCVCI